MITSQPLGFDVHSCRGAAGVFSVFGVDDLFDGVPARLRLQAVDPMRIHFAYPCLLFLDKLLNHFPVLRALLPVLGPL